MIPHFKSFNFFKLPFNNLRLPKSEKVILSHQLKIERAKGKVYNILVFDLSKWTNILRHIKREKWTDKMGQREYLKRQHNRIAATEM